MGAQGAGIAQAFGSAIGQTGAATQQREAASQTGNPYYGTTGFVSRYQPRPQQQRPTSNPWAGYGAASQAARQAAWSAPGPYAGPNGGPPNSAADALRRYQSAGQIAPRQPASMPAYGSGAPGSPPPVSQGAGGGITPIAGIQPVIGSVGGAGNNPPIGSQPPPAAPARLPGQAGFTPEGGYTTPGISAPQNTPPAAPSVPADDFFKGGPTIQRPSLAEPTPQPMDFPMSTPAPAPAATPPAPAASPLVTALRVPGTIGGVAPRVNAPRTPYAGEV